MARNIPQFFSVTRRTGAQYRVVDALRSALRWLVYWDDLARQRRALGRLEDRLLEDVGVTRAEAKRESRSSSVPWWWGYGPR